MARFNPLAPVVTGDVLQLTVTIQQVSQQMEITFHYQSTLPGIMTPTIMQAFITSWRVDQEANLKACLSDAAVITKYSAADRNPGTVVTQEAFVAVPGAVAFASHPTYVSSPMQRVSALKGQHGRGRIEIPAVPISFVTPAVDPNRSNAAGNTAYNALAADLADNVIGGGVTWNAIIASAPVAPSTIITRGARITSYLHVLLMGTVRRRREGRGI